MTWRAPITKRPCRDCGNEIEARHAKYCDECRWRHRIKPAKYNWTPERDAWLRREWDGNDRGRAAQIAKAFGWPQWVLSKRARTLGLTRPRYRKEWSSNETAFLTEHLGSRTTIWIARKLGRTETSVVLRAKRLHLSRKIDNGYSSRAVAEGFGIDSHAVLSWIRRGWLKASRGQMFGPHESWAIAPEAVRAFIKSHPTEFDIRKVDQVWFLDVLGVINGEVAA